MQWRLWPPFDGIFKSVDTSHPDTIVPHGRSSQT
jgi:hypothetical protein